LLYSLHKQIFIKTMSSKSDFNKDDSLNDTISDEESNQNKLL